jgi:hypothetical protein
MVFFPLRDSLQQGLARHSVQVQTFRREGRTVAILLDHHARTGRFAEGRRGLGLAMNVHRIRIENSRLCSGNIVSAFFVD